MTTTIYKSFCYVQILTIPAATFIGRTAASGSAGPGVSHDLNVYPRCVGWQFMAHHHGKPQLFETSLSNQQKSY